MRWLLGGCVAAACAVVAPAAHALPGPPLREPAQMLQQALECTPTLNQPSVTPVLLVHGTTSTPEDNWSWNYRLVLPNEGYPTCTVRLPDRALTDMQRSVEYVVHAIRRMYERAETPVSVIGHSQGGLLPTYALRFWPDLAYKVDDFIGLAPVLGKGTAGANLICSGPPCVPAFWQFRPDSNLLKAYNSRDLPLEPSYTSIYTLFDQIVLPQPQASTLQVPPGVAARSISVQDFCGYPRSVDHVLIVGDAVSYALVIDALSHPGPADPARVSREVCSAVAMPGADELSFAVAIPRFMAGVAQVPFSPLVEPREPPLRCYLDPACPKVRLKPGLRGAHSVGRKTRTRQTIRTDGEVVLPPNATQACSGTVTIRVRRGARIVSSRRAAVDRFCFFTSRAVVARTRRPLRVDVRFNGSEELLPARSRRRVG